MASGHIYCSRLGKINKFLLHSASAYICKSPVTKIGKLSVFSGLNNLNDISMESGYSDICGISDSDLHRYFGESTKELAAANGMTEEQCYSKLAEMYDGYHFSRKSNGMYNPFSLLNTFKKMEFSEYWFETGTPTFLVKLLKRTDYDIRRIADADVEIDIDMISGVNDYINDPIPVLYQSGYLTIRSFDEMFGIYRLGFPNMEVRKGYARPFAADSRKLFRIGVSFSKGNRRIEDWKILDSEA